MSAKLPLALLLLPLAAAPLRAQTVAGEAVDPETNERIPSAMVVLVEASGREHSSTLTDGMGRFTLRAGSPGIYTLRLERVGYANTVSPQLRLEARQTLTYRLAANQQRIQLQGLVVTGRSRCTPRAQGGMEVAVLWDEARKALRGTRGTEGARPYRYRVNRFARTTRADDGLVLEDSARTTSALLAKPFVSVPGTRLEQGWVQSEGNSTVYFAPDAETLTGAFFVETHCFRVIPARGEERGWIGLAFEPVRERRVPEIEGTLWLDSATAELRRLEYRYTGLAIRGAVGRRLGGEVDFHRLPDGAWIVRRWRIRLPEVSERRSGGEDLIRVAPLITAVREEGGEVTEIRTAAGEPVRLEAGAQLAGVAWDSTRAAPLAGARVELAGTGAVAVSDATGAYVLRDLIDGDYELRLTHPRLDSLGYDAPPARVRVRRGGTARHDFAVPSLGTLLTAGCATTAGQAALAGYVRGTDGMALPSAAITVAWGADPAAERVTLRSDAAGFFRACSVPADVPLQVAAFVRGGRATSSVRLAAGQRAYQDLAVDLPMDAVAAAPPAAPGEGTAAAGTPVTGQVLDARTGRGVSAATVRLAGQRVLTGRDGRFAFAAVTPGPYELQVEHTSYPDRRTHVNVLQAAGTEIEVRVAEADAARPEQPRQVASTEAEVGASSTAGNTVAGATDPSGTGPVGGAVQLQPIVAVARPVRPAAERRERASGRLGTSISRDDIEQRLEAARNVGDLVRGLSGLNVVEDPRQLRLVSRGEQVGVFLDGFYADPVTVRNLQPHLVESMEFIPNGDPRWGNGPILLIWTLTGERGSRRESVEKT
ncbi:MAG TPA: carboxypeptidase regulatory-like domain-containing protein [Longimicrobiaceae bacterium]|nr:carboxypeptidase regulatory-like domain-containing protein [Longimicrobiaceae bacterium]